MSARALPRLTQASVPLTRSIQATDERGNRIEVRVPVERALTLYLDRKEIVTLMTLGAHPEWLVLGYLLSQRLIESAADLESITVDWETNAAGVRTRSPAREIGFRNASRVVTTGCGQGSMFSDLLDTLEPVPDHFVQVRQDTLAAIVNAVRQHDTLYKKAGSVHACALFSGESLRIFIEDVGRHNALDKLIGARRGDCRGALVLTCRTSIDMVQKAAIAGFPMIIAASAPTAAAVRAADGAGITLIALAREDRFEVFTHPHRIAPEEAADVA